MSSDSWDENRSLLHFLFQGLTCQNLFSKRGSGFLHYLSFTWAKNHLQQVSLFSLCSLSSVFRHRNAADVSADWSVQRNLFSLNKVTKDKTFQQRHTEKIGRHLGVPCAPGRRLAPSVCYLQTHTHKQRSHGGRGEEEEGGGGVRPLFSLTAVFGISLFPTGK